MIWMDIGDRYEQQGMMVSHTPPWRRSNKPTRNKRMQKEEKKKEDLNEWPSARLHVVHWECRPFVSLEPFVLC